jgi:CubicO group peptidase (beta-lactamase class C family)
MRAMDHVTAGNWLDGRHTGWSLQHVPDLLATADIARGGEPVREFSSRVPSAELEADAFCADTYTDALLVIQGESILLERYFGGMTPDTRHLVMSVSKSVCGMTAGALAGAGDLDLAAPAARYVPELAAGPYGAAAVADLLAMTAPHQYSMDHTDPESEVSAEDRAAGWRPRRPGDPAGGSRAFLARLGFAAGTGARFQYSSATTEVLSWVLERAASTPYARLVSEVLWTRMGAEQDAYITVDASGTPYGCAGIGMTLRDLARFGRLILDGGRQVIPRTWIKETFAGGDPALLRDEPFSRYLPDGSYRNQWWVTGNGPMYAAGLLGQYLWLDPAADLIIAKFSHIPVEADLRAVHVRAFEAITGAVT